jgi:hypothetical protein
LGDFEKVVEERTNFSSARSCWAPGRRVMGTQLSTKTRAAKCRQTVTPKPRNVHGNRLMERLLTLSQSRKMPHRSRKIPQRGVYHRSNARDLRYMHRYTWRVSH